MKRRLSRLAAICCLCVSMSLVLSGSVFAQEEELEAMVEGVIEEVAPEAGYMVVGGTKIMADSDFFASYETTVGDKVVVFAEKTDDGLVAYDCVPMEEYDMEAYKKLEGEQPVDAAAMDATMETEAIKEEQALQGN